jgi:large subunit ribosomal protein L15
LKKKLKRRLKKMYLDKLKINGNKRTKKVRIGRGPGSGMGKTSARGEKGQKSRSGAGKPPWFEGGQQRFTQRVPKSGFKNFTKESFEIVNLGFLNEKFESGASIDKTVLYDKGYIASKIRKLKILGTGDVSKSFTVKADKFSKSAAEKIVKAGGKAEN